MTYSDPSPNQNFTSYHTSYGFSPPVNPDRRLIRSYAGTLGLALLLYYLVATALGYLQMLAVYSLPFFWQLPTAWQEDLELIQDMVSYSLAFLVPIFVCRAVIKIPYASAFPLRPVRAGTLAASLPVALSVSAIGVSAASYVALLLGLLGFRSGIPDDPIPGSPVGLLLFIVQLVVLPPIFEELFFRGVIMQSLRRFGDGFALLVSSLLFALLHIYPAQLPNAFLMGLVLGFFALRTESLYTGMFIHMVNNGIAAILSILEVYLEPTALNILLYILYSLYIVLGIFCLVYFLRKNPAFFKLNPSSCSLSFRAAVKTFFTAIPMIVALLLIGWRIVEVVL